MAVGTPTSVATNDEIITQLTTSWDSEDHGLTRTWHTPIVKFSIADTAPDSPDDEADGFVPMDAHQKDMARLAFTLWGDVMGVQLGEITSPNAQITFGYTTTMAATNTGRAGRDLDDPVNGDRAFNHAWVWVNSTKPATASAAVTIGSVGFGTYLHEIGHSLGMSHSGQYDAANGTTTYGVDNEYTHDTKQYTIMSYFTAGSDGSGANYNGVRPSTPMIDDILTIQAKYGANLSTRTDSTVYGFNTTITGVQHAVYDFSVNQDPVLTIWDAGGFDTLDTSGFSNTQRITLAAGTYSDVGGLTGNIGIAYDVVVEHAVGGSGRDDMTGNDVANALSGNAGNDTLRGGIGTDTLRGGADRDRLEGGADADSLFGDDGNDTMDGGEGADTLHGGSGDDDLSGGAGDDTYYVDTFDSIIELVGGGVDAVYASASYSLAPSLENLTLTGAAGLNGWGNSLGNVITGNTGRNSLDGGGGNDTIYGGGGIDTMAGGVGDDIYLVDTADAVRLVKGRAVVVPGDLVVENEGEGNDLVFASVSYALVANVERLQLTLATNINGTGNALDNSILGNAGANRLNGLGGRDTLDGAGGADTMAGGTGDDAYYLDVAGDSILEDAEEGEDTVVVAFTYTLGENVENIELQGSENLNGTGNALANKIAGNSGPNILTGGSGSDTLIGGRGVDTMAGGDGDDTYYVDVGPVTRVLPSGEIVLIAPGDDVRENVGEGRRDVVFASVSYILSANVERLELTGTANISGVGSAGDNILVGNVGNNNLQGGAGDDTLNGGLLDSDTASYSDALGALKISLAKTTAQAVGGGLGSDTLISIKNLTGGDFDDTLSGDGRGNVLQGADGADTLDGGAGADTLDGGEDGDLYYAGGADTILDTGTVGRDKIIVGTGYTLTDASGIEDLQQQNPVTAPAAGSTTTLVGNGLANVIVGNGYDNRVRGLGGDDSLQGGAGADTLEGGAGVDSLRGDAGADVFFFQTADSPASLTTFDTILDFTSADDTVDLVLGAASLAAGAYGEVALNSNTFSALQARAETEMTAGKKVVFVAGSAHGWLFWNADADAAAEGAVRLFQKTSLAAFEHADLL